MEPSAWSNDDGVPKDLSGERYLMEIHVHVGVHKTATTYLQNLLKGEARDLRQKGIGYAPLGRIRSSLTRRLMSFDQKDFKIEDQLGMFFESHVVPARPRLIISDENLIGYCGSIVANGRGFENVEARMSQLRRLLGKHQISLFVAVRCYDGFLSSAYSEGLRNLGRFVAIDDFRRRLDIDSIRWPNLIQKMRAGLEPTRTVIWRFEDFPQIGDDVRSELTFNASAVRSVSATPERPSFSQIAVDVMHTVAERHGAAVASALIDQIGSALPKDSARSAFDPWSAEERAALKTLYAEDCRAIDAHLWLQPGGRTAPTACEPSKLINTRLG